MLMMPLATLLHQGSVSSKSLKFSLSVPLLLKSIKLGMMSPNLTVQDYGRLVFLHGWIQDTRTRGGRIPRPRSIHMT